MGHGPLFDLSFIIPGEVAPQRLEMCHARWYFWDPVPASSTAAGSRWPTGPIGTLDGYFRPGWVVALGRVEHLLTRNTMSPDWLAWSQSKLPWHRSGAFRRPKWTATTAGWKNGDLQRGARHWGLRAWLCTRTGLHRFDWWFKAAHSAMAALGDWRAKARMEGCNEHRR